MQAETLAAANKITEQQLTLLIPVGVESEATDETIEEFVPKLEFNFELEETKVQKLSERDEDVSEILQSVRESGIESVISAVDR
jgi:hypothetical protein